jgi:GntR family transcriptional repressor for pyruvate dehydrogenase complex
MFKQIKIRHVAEEVFDQIKAAIETGKLKPGEKLPAERELISQLGVSRVPIREALKLLANMGFIETRQGGGSYVRSLLCDRLLDPLGAIIGDSAEKLFELVEVRKEIETWSACYAAKEATPEDLVTLGRMLEEMKMYLETSGKVPVGLDTDFHLAISRSCSNTIRAHLFHTIQTIFSDYFRLTIEAISDQQDQRLLYDQHAQIFDAIRRRDAKGARDAITRHLTFVAEELKKQVPGESELGAHLSNMKR